MEKGLSKFILLATLFLYGCKNNDKPFVDVSPSDFENTLKNMNKAIVSTPDEDSLYLVRGSFYLENEKFEEAVLDFMQAWKLDSTHPEALHKLSDTYLAYFKSYEALQILIKAVEKFQRTGAKSIDVGIMQINLRHHPHAFRNLEEAFDPQLNIAYGAKFLKQLFLGSLCF
jgi:tetratricopeptide (TPR) repeat protein